MFVNNLKSYDMNNAFLYVQINFVILSIHCADLSFQFSVPRVCYVHSFYNRVYHLVFRP